MQKIGTIIAGACSVESRSQIIKTAIELSFHTEGEIDFLRGGIWKPRTKPNQFEGLGAPALAFLKQAGDAIERPVMTEVASREHVKQANKAGIDAYWLGARSTGCPFLIDDIIRELTKNRKKVFVKNPMCGSFDLWSGAIERLLQADIEVAAIHRGAFFKFSKYRNLPIWSQALEIREKFDIEVLTDVSHIAGDAEKLKEIASISHFLNFDGYMIEAHTNPTEALTDAKQQIKPEQLTDLLDFSTDQIDSLRSCIDVYDYFIFSTLEDRQKLASLIIQEKMKRDIDLTDAGREQEVIEALVESFEDRELVTNVMKAIFEHSKNQIAI